MQARSERIEDIVVFDRRMLARMALSRMEIVGVERLRLDCRDFRRVKCKNGVNKDKPKLKAWNGNNAAKIYRLRARAEVRDLDQNLWLNVITRFQRHTT